MDDRYFDTYSSFERLSGFMARTSTRAFFSEVVLQSELTDIILKSLNISGNQVVWPVQIHSGTVVFTHDPGEIPKCDGLVTDRDDLYLLIRTADCVPLFLGDKDSGLKALIHAGWRGISQGIGENTVHMMKKKGSCPENIMATFGPAICEECYDVGEDVAKLFPEHVRQKKNKFLLSLKSALVQQLMAAGMKSENILLTNRCTLCQRERYVSYRFDKTTGRLISIIGKSI